MKNKKLWGILGLIIVAAMTVAAYFTPAANAESGSTTITVNVSNPKSPAIDITKPANNAEVVYTDGVYLDLAFEETEGLEIVATPEGGTPIEDAFAPTEESGTTRYRIVNNSLSLFFGQVAVTAKATAEGSEGSTKNIVINLVPAIAEITDPDDNNDPAINITANPNVEEIEIVVTDPENPDKPVVKKKIAIKGTTNPIVLPFEDENVPDGNYQFTMTSYDENGDVLGEPTAINYTYKHDKDPIVPDTGSFSEHLNVSSTDYLVVSLVAAGFAVVALIVLIIKRSRR